MTAVSMSKQEFSRLEVLLRVKAAALARQLVERRLARLSRLRYASRSPVS